MLSQIRNWKQCNAGIPGGYEASAVIEAVMEGWDLCAVEATAERGVAQIDLEGMRDIIRDEELSCSLDACRDRLIAVCRAQLAAAAKAEV